MKLLLLSRQALTFTGPWTRSILPTHTREGILLEDLSTARGDNHQCALGGFQNIPAEKGKHDRGERNRRGQEGGGNGENPVK